MAQTKQYVMGWLATYAKPSTRHVFKAGVVHFLESVYGSVGDVEELAARYVEECRAGRDWFKDLLKYAADLHERPPKTSLVFMAGAKSWLEYTLDVELSRKQARLLNGRLPKGRRARTQEAELTREILRRILSHADLKGRALFLFLASSGVRVGEALKLRLGDVNLTVDPPEVNVRGEYTKTGDAYTTFLTVEAKEALVEWLKVREAYILSSGGRCTGLSRGKSLQDSRIFPFSVTVAETAWRNAIRKAGLAEKDAFTNRHSLHIHMLRKFFLSQAKIVAPESVVEAWAGHAAGLDTSYRRYSREQMREFYKKAEPYLLIGVPKDISEIQSKFQKDVDELRAQVADLTRKLTDANSVNLQLMNENMQLQKRVAELEKRIEAAGKILEQLKAQVKELSS